MPTAEEVATKRFEEQDKVWSGPRFIVLGMITLSIAISLIYMMSRTQGCTLQFVP